MIKPANAVERDGPQWGGLFTAILAATLAGCALISPQPPQTVSYRCDNGKEFAVTYPPPGEIAMIEIAGMRFPLLPEPSAEPEERYGCSVLTLWRRGEEARVEMEGDSLYVNCRQRR